MSGIKQNRATGLQWVIDNLPNNSNRLITEEIMREALSNLWKSGYMLIDEEIYVNLRELNDRPYTVGECATYNNGGGNKIWQCISPVVGFPFNPAEWVELGSAGVLSFNSRVGAVVPQSNDYSASMVADDSTLNKGTVKLALEYLEQLSTQTAVNTFFVNSNNPNAGDGSISNPFQSVDLAYNTIVGSGTPKNPELVPANESVSIIVQGGVYTTSKNLLINRVNWQFDNGTTLDYQGTNYLFEVNSTVYDVNSGYQSVFILGKCAFKTINGGFVKTLSGNGGSGVTLNISGRSFRSEYVSATPTDKVLFDLNDGTNTWQFSPIMNLVLDDDADVISYTQTMLRNGNAATGIGRKRFNVIGGNWFISNGAHDLTQSADSRMFDLNKTIICQIKNVTLQAGKSDYLIRISGQNQKIDIDNVNFSTTTSSAIQDKSKGLVDFAADFSVFNVSGVSTAVAGVSITDSKNLINNWSSNEIMAYLGTGDLETIYVDGCTFQTNIPSNIKIAKSISFEPNLANPKPYIVQNNINDLIRMSNLEENNVVSKQMMVDDDGNIYWQLATSGGNTFTFGLNESGGVVKLGGAAVGNLSIYGDSSDVVLSQDYAIGYDLSKVATEKAIDSTNTYRTSTEVVDVQGNSDVITNNATTIGGFVSYFTRLIKAGTSVVGLLGAPGKYFLKSIKDKTDEVNNTSEVGVTNGVGGSGNPESFMRVTNGTGNDSSATVKQGEFEVAGAEIVADSINQDDALIQVVVRDSVSNKLKWRDASTIGGGGGSVYPLVYVKNGQVGAQVVMETHSSFSQVSGKYLNGGVTYNLVGMVVNAGLSSVTQASTCVAEVRRQNTGTQHSVGLGTLVHQQPIETSVGAIGSTYGFGKSFSFAPIPMVGNQIYYVDFNPVFWTFRDLEIILLVNAS